MDVSHELTVNHLRRGESSGRVGRSMARWRTTGTCRQARHRAYDVHDDTGGYHEGGTAIRQQEQQKPQTDHTPTGPATTNSPMGFADKKAGIGEGNAEVFPLVLDDSLIGYELKAKSY